MWSKKSINRFLKAPDDFSWVSFILLFYKNKSKATLERLIYFRNCVLDWMDVPSYNPHRSTNDSDIWGRRKSPLHYSESIIWRNDDWVGVDDELSWLLPDGTNRLSSTKYQIQMKLILLCVWAEPAILSSTKTALEFKYEI